MSVALATFEAVDGALQAFLRREELPPIEQGREACRAWFRIEWVLIDTCVVAGMPLDHSAPAEWAAELVAACLSSSSLVVDEEGDAE